MGIKIINMSGYQWNPEYYIIKALLLTNVAVAQHHF